MGRILCRLGVHRWCELDMGHSQKFIKPFSIWTPRPTLVCTRCHCSKDPRATTDGRAAPSDEVA